MFVIKTQEKPADKTQDVGHRVHVFRDDVLHYIAPWNEERNDAWNHRNAALASLLKGMNGGFIPHHVVGAAPVPGHDFWVVAIQEGE